MRDLAAVAMTIAIAFGCTSNDAEADREPPPKAPTMAGKARPAPSSALEHARRTVDALAGDDWAGYRNQLSNRADMIGIYADTPTHKRRARRKRRRSIWRRINRLRKETAEEGWHEVRETAAAESFDLSSAQIESIRSMPTRERLPDSAEALHLYVALRHGETTRWLDLGTCIHVTRGWVTLSPLSWSHFGPDDDAAVLFGTKPSPAQ